MLVVAVLGLGLTSALLISARTASPAPPDGVRPAATGAASSTAHATAGESSLEGASAPGGLAAYASEGLPRSVPTALDIPAIGVHSPLLQLGINPDGTVQVPPLERDSRAGWLSASPTPGEVGPAVLLGHINSAQYGPGVFARLAALRPGQPVRVTRADGTVAQFVVDRVASYRKDAFPSLQVYGNTPNPQLRLITCGGVFDRAARSYESNTVVYAHLVTG